MIVRAREEIAHACCCALAGIAKRRNEHLTPPSRSRISKSGEWRHARRCCAVRGALRGRVGGIQSRIGSDASGRRNPPRDSTSSRPTNSLYVQRLAIVGPGAATERAPGRSGAKQDVRRRCKSGFLRATRDSGEAAQIVAASCASSRTKHSRRVHRADQPNGLNSSIVRHFPVPRVMHIHAITILQRQDSMDRWARHACPPDKALAHQCDSSTQTTAKTLPFSALRLPLRLLLED